MIVILLLRGLPVMIGTVACRRTRIHPLMIGPAMTVVSGVAILIALAGFVGVHAVRIAPAIALFPGVAGALGGFLGWLRRQHMERMNA